MTNIGLLGCCNHVYPVGTLHIRLPLAQFQDFVIALMPLNACTLIHELRTSTGVNVSYQTIRNRLRTRNLRPRCPTLSPLHDVIGDYVWVGVDDIFAGQHVSGPLFAFRTNHDLI